MQFTTLLLILIGVILVADLAIVATASARRDHGSRRAAVDGLVRSGRLLGSAAGERLRAWQSIARPAAATREDARTAAAIEAFVADVDGRAGGGIQRRTPPANQVSPGEVAPAATDSRPATARARALGPADPAPSATWEALLADESARIRRFGRPATIVLAECPDLDIVGARLGAEAANRIAAEIDRVLHAESRLTDRVVRLGPGRFGVLMVETGETPARRYVERVRDVASEWFAAAGLSRCLAIGWASPAKGEDLFVAASTALLRARADVVESLSP